MKRETSAKESGIDFVRKLRMAFMTAIITLLSLVVARLIAENYIIKSQFNQARYQSTSGNQKMLSQRIAMLSLALVRAESDETKQRFKESLLSHADEMAVGQKFLLSNNSIPELSGLAREILTSPPENLNDLAMEFIEHAKELATADVNDINLRNKNLHQLITLSSTLLDKFSRLAEVLKEDGIRGVKLVRSITNSFSVITILLLIILYHLIFIPVASRAEVEFKKRHMYEKRLLSVNNELEQFASIAAHDLRAPLQNIKAFASLLSDMNQTNDPEEFNNYVTKIEDGVVRLEVLIKDLLDYARSNSGNIHFVKVNLKSLVESVIKESYSLDSVKFEMDFTNSPEVVGDQLLLSIVFNNVISNSIKYADPNRDLQVSIKSMKVPTDKNSIVIEIEDNGIGFESDTIDEIFKPFKRQNQAATLSGSGLGLSICYRIIRKHKGDILASNSKSGGAKITIKMPLKLKRGHAELEL